MGRLFGDYMYGFVALVLILGTTLISSCESNEALPQYQNPNKSDTTGVNVVYDLFVSAQVDNIPLYYTNGINDYSNWSISEEGGFCLNDPNYFVQSHVTAFLKPTLIKEAIYIDIRGCVNNDSLKDINKVDSVLVVGPYPYFPKQKDNRTAIVKFIDQDSVLWSTALGGNNSSFSKFELSAVVSNNDPSAAHVAFGKFEGYFYNGLGDSLRIKDGQFKGRIVN